LPFPGRTGVPVQCDGNMLGLRLTLQTRVGRKAWLVEPKRESDTGRSEAKIPGLACLLGVVFLPLLGWLVEVSHWVSPLTEGSVLLGVIVGATLCAVYGLSSISKGPPVRLKTYIPGLACVLGSGFVLYVGRFAEIRHWVSPASISDFWLSLGVVLGAPTIAILGLILIRKGPPGAWNWFFTGVAAISLTLVSGYCFRGMIGLLM